MNLESLWRRFTQDPKEESFRQLFTAMHGTLYAYGMKLSQDPCTTRDAIQNLFLNLWQYQRRLNSEARPLPYLFRSLRNEIVRIRKQFPEHDDIESLAGTLVFLPAEFRDERFDEREKITIIRVLNLLPPRQKEILYLRFYENLSYEDISAILDIQYQSVINHAFRAISKLRASDVLRKTVFS